LALCIGPNFIREIVLVVKDREGIFCHVFGDILSFKFVWHLCIREIVLEVKDREGYSVVLCVWQYSEL
jgi:hypothetical protein